MRKGGAGSERRRDWVEIDIMALRIRQILAKQKAAQTRISDLEAGFAELVAARAAELAAWAQLDAEFPIPVANSVPPADGTNRGS